MSRPVRDRLTDLATDVDQVRLAPAADVRARGRSRARRHRAGTVTALAALVVAAGFGVSTVAGRDRAPVVTAPAAPSPACIPADLSLPDDPGEVTIQVVGGSDRAEQVADQLGDRGFAAGARFRIDPDPDSRGTVAVLRYGPRGIGHATLVRAFVTGDAVMKFVPGREDRTVDLVLGSDFRGLASTTQVNQKLVALGEPTRPPGSC